MGAKLMREAETGQPVHRCQHELPKTVQITLGDFDTR